MYKALAVALILTVFQGCAFLKCYDQKKINRIDKEFKHEPAKEIITVHWLDDEYGLICLRIHI